MRTKNKLFNDLITESLFNSNKTITKNDLKNMGVCRYDLGKYDTNQKGENPATDIPVWYELRADSNGKYLIINCFDKQNSEIIKLWNKINK